MNYCEVKQDEDKMTEVDPSQNEIELFRVKKSFGCICTKKERESWGYNPARARAVLSSINSTKRENTHKTSPHD